MPYYIAVYDVATDRGAKALKLFRRYLTWIQNSVFEGELTKAQAAELETEARALLETGDSVILFELRTTAYLERRVLGTEHGARGPIL